MSGLEWFRFCGVIGCCLLAMALGCQRAEETASIIDKATGLRMASDLTFVIASGENRPMACATLLNASDKSFYVAAPIELVTQPGWRLVEWRGEFDGQKFERVEHSEFEVLASEPGLKIAIVRVHGTTAKRAVVLARTDGSEFRRDFAAYSCRASSPRPLKPIGVKVQGLASARAAPELPSAEFFRVTGGLDFMMLGSPLVTEQGELAAVAVGHFWDSQLYCPADSLRKIMHGVLGSTE